MGKLDALTSEEKVELAERACRHIVAHWESIEQRATELQIRIGLTNEARNKVADDMRALLGGEELYLAAKEYLNSSAATETV
jgi:hypothetical protein